MLAPGPVGLAAGQSAGVGGPYFRDDCNTLTVHVTNKILCWEQSTGTLKKWNGSAWTSISPIGAGDVTHTGTLDANFFILGNGLASIKSLSLTGYVFGNGASAPTASATIPTSVLTGALLAAQFPALTGDGTTVAGALAFTLAASGATPGTYTKVTVDAKGRVTVGATFSFATDGTGNLPVTRLNSGTGASGSTCWFGDGTWKACTSASGGTVTNTGTMTADRVVLGNAGVDIKVMASAGTATTLLHGGSPPTYSAVDLAADTSGLVPTTKGGTNVDSSGFTGLAKVTAGVWSAYGGSGPCSAGQFVTSISALGVLTCTAGGSITGSGALNRVPFWTGASTVSADSQFVWDNTLKGLALGGETATRTLSIGNPGGAFFSFTRSSVEKWAVGNDGSVIADTFIIYGGGAFRLAVLQTGEVGIGTQSPAFGLDVVKTSKAARLSRLTLADANTGSSFDLCANCYYDGANKYLAAGFAGRIELLPASGEWRIQTGSTSGLANGALTLTDRVLVTQLGLMGINQASVLNWLDIVNTIPIGTSRVSAIRASGAVTGAVTTTTVSVEVGDQGGTTFPLYVAGAFIDFTNTPPSGAPNPTVISFVNNLVTLGGFTGVGVAGGGVGQLVNTVLTGTASANHAEWYGIGSNVVFNPTGVPADTHVYSMLPALFLKHRTNGEAVGLFVQLTNIESPGTNGVYGIRIRNGNDNVVTPVAATTALDIVTRKGSGSPESWTNAIDVSACDVGSCLDTRRFLVRNDASVSILMAAASNAQLAVASASGDGNGVNIKLTHTGGAGNPTKYLMALNDNFEIRNQVRSLIFQMSDAGLLILPSIDVATTGGTVQTLCIDGNNHVFRKTGAC